MKEDKKIDKKEVYEKPVLRPIQLFGEEVLAIGCKNAGHSGYINACTGNKFAPCPTRSGS